MVYLVSYGGALWHAADRKFPHELAAIQHIQGLPELKGYEGRIVRISKDRMEVHFDGLSRFSSLAG